MCSSTSTPILACRTSTGTSTRSRSAPRSVLTVSRRRPATGQTLNVLVTSISRKVPMLTAVREAIERQGITGSLIGADANENCIGKYFVDQFWNTPGLRADHGNDFIEECVEGGVGLVIPSRDGELGGFASLSESLLSRGISVMVSSSEAVAACNDKLVFSRRLAELGLPVIPSDLTPLQFDGKTLVVKERFGAGAARIGL